MKVDLKKYFETRDRIRQEQNTPGPVLTISRMFGCEAGPVAHRLIREIAQLSSDKINQNWQMISKEIITDAAHELHINPVKIESVLDAKQVTGLGHMLTSLNSHYDITDKTILNTLREILHVYAAHGKTIIIGRGGAFLTRRIERSFHIKLSAPLEWRVQQIQQKRNLSYREARALVEAMDEKRARWIEHMTGRPVANDDFYDIVFNRELLSEDTIVNTTLALMNEKHLIQNNQPKLSLMATT